MKYDNWFKKIPREVSDDPVWNLKVYRISLFLSDLTWEDIETIQSKKKLYSLTDQLYRSVGSISANITEGYSRKSHKEKARFYEISLGSARESKDWYFKSRHVLGGDVTQHRMEILTSIIKLLLTMINTERKSSRVSETVTEYGIDSIQDLLQNPPTVS